MADEEKLATPAVAARIEPGKLLWSKVLQDRPLLDDIYERPLDGKEPLLLEINSFLQGEEIKYADRPNTARSLLLLQSLLAPRSGKTTREDGKNAFLKADLAPSAAPDTGQQTSNVRDTEQVIEKAFAEIATSAETESPNYIAGTGPYSSVYAALLALLLDEITISHLLRALETALDDPEVVAQLARPVMKPNALFLTRYFRGQRQDWLPVPKMLRRDRVSKSMIRNVQRQLCELLAASNFGAAVAGLKLPGLNKLMLEGLQQHYGFPTRLLDVTTNMEVGAFFATYKAHSDGIGVIYRYHLAHPLALQILASWVAKVAELGMPLPKQMERVATAGSRSLGIVSLDEAPRIRQQDGAFIRGVELWAAHNFFQPIYFHQSGETYTNLSRNISEVDLFPPDDPIELLAAPIRKRFSIG